MTEDTVGLPPIPGLDAVGRGIYLRPYQPYELKGLLFKQEDFHPYLAPDTNLKYMIPKGYEVNDSPPMPANQALNQTMIEESWDRFEKQRSLDASAAVSTGIFSVNVSTAQKSQMRSEEEAYYAVRSSFIPLWAVYLADAIPSTDPIDQFDIPVPFRYSHRKAYEAFFERFGSHYVKRAWVGGKAELIFTVAKSSQLTKEEIQSAIRTSYAGVGEISGNDNQQRSKEKLRSSSRCTVFGRGGDELKLASLNTLHEAIYNEWLASIRGNPQTIELEVAGIWNLLKDPEKATALLEAYKAATTFTPISAAFSADRKVYFVRGRRYFTYDVESGTSEKPKPLIERWPRLAELGFDRIDSAVSGSQLQSHTGESLARKVFLFRREQFIRIDLDKDDVDEGYPRLISEGWPGLPFERIDVALAVGRDAVYFFQANKYVRFNMTKNRVEEGYPDLISRRWVGVTFDRLDAALYWGNGKVYFFKDDQHIRYDLVMCRTDPGYPKCIVGNYVEDWKFFD